jgi:D-serine deaminase-like pyridoxal phosphate-dependent protein
MKIGDLDTPAVCVDVDVMERNLRQAASYCAEHLLKLRPHTKTHKIPELAQKQILYGATGITVAKLGEAEVMADAGLDNILIAYPIYGEQKWRRLIELCKRRDITVSVDSATIAEGISAQAAAEGIAVKVLVEFDTGFGRCGLPIKSESACIVKQIANMKKLEFCGVLLYPGHFLVSREQRERLLECENRQLLMLKEVLHSNGIKCAVVSGGSTPTMYMAHRLSGVTEIRPGTYIFNDKNTVECGAARYGECAVSVITSVVSTSVAGRAIIDGGSKTFSGDRLLSGDKQGFGHVVEDPAIYFEAMSEEHGHLDVGKACTRLKVGDRLRIVPNHVCACINMHDTIYGIQGDNVVAEYRVAARGAIR